MFKAILIIFLFSVFSVSAEVVKVFKVEGNKRISSETIKVYGEIEEGKDYTNSQLNNIIKNLYSTNFFENISISINQNIMKIIVKEYPVINSIEVFGEKSNNIKKLILEKLALKEKESFVESKLNEDTILIKKIYSSLGYNFANVSTRVQNFSDNRINLIYDLEKGDKTFIKKIDFTGDKKIKEKRLRDIIVSEENKFWKFLSKNTYYNKNTTELDKRLLINYYKSLGYYDVQVLSSNAEINNQKDINLIYTINAGERYKVNKISMNLSDVFDKNIFSPLEKNYLKILGKYYSPFKIKKLLDELDLLISNNDLQFVEHSVNEILENGNIEIIINVYEGQKQLVERINVLGNSVTEESVIRSELLLDEGDPFSNLKLEQSIANLKSRNIFGEVNTKILDGTTNDLKTIDLIVEEKPTGEISAGAGVGTSGGSFAFKIAENNWLGKGINLSTNLDISSETFTGGINITDPNFNLSGNLVNLYVQNTKNDKPDSGYKNNIISTGASTTFEQYKNVYLSPGFAFSYDDLKVENTASAALKKQKGTFSDLSFQYGVALDTRDKSYNPTSGYISNFNQSIPLYADAPSIKNTYQFNYYNAFTQNMIGAFKFYSSAVNGMNNEDVRISKRVNLPSSRLRGFEYGKVGPKDGSDYVGGNYAISSNFEINLPNLLPESTKTDVGLFMDFGNVWGIDYDNSIDESNKIRSTIGLATNWLSPVGPMSFVFSQNVSKASTDVTESFNFRLGTTF